jgi:hypothetical protein
LEHSSSESERYFLYDSIGDTFLHLYTDTTESERRLAYVTEACEIFSKAIAFKSADSVTVEDDFDSGFNCAEIYISYAKAEFL